MKPGDALPVWRHEVRAAAMIPIAGILRDPNPIHLDPAAVAAMGLGDRVINQGPANLAYLVNMLAAAFPDHRLESLESRFLGNVRDGDVVEGGGVVTAWSPTRVTCELWLKASDPRPAVKGTAVLVHRTLE